MAGYIFKGDYAEALQAMRFPSPEAFLKPADDKLLALDPHRAPFLGEESEIQALKEILTNRTNKQYSQGDYFGAIFTKVPMYLLNAHTLSDEKQFCYNYTVTCEVNDFSVGFLNPKNEPCAFSVAYHPLNPNQWTIAYIRHTCAAPEDRVIKLITSVDYFGQQSPFQPADVTRLRKQLMSMLETDALKTLFQDLITESGEINLTCIPFESDLHCHPSKLIKEKLRLTVPNQELAYLRAQVEALEGKAKKLPLPERRELLWVAQRMRRQIERIPRQKEEATEALHLIIENIDSKILNKLPAIAEILARIVRALHIKPAIQFFENRKARREASAIEGFINQVVPTHS